MRRWLFMLVIVLCAAPLYAQEEGIFGDVVIRCNGADADVMASVRFNQPTATAFYTVRVYGLDGLQPAFLLETSLENDLEPCRESEAVNDVTLTLAGETIDTGIQRAELNIDSSTNMGMVTIAFAALNNTRGRFVAFIDGLSIAAPDDSQRVDVDAGAYAIAESPLLIYMIKSDPLSRLDPLIENVGTESVCDDAGRRGCDTVPYASDYGISDGGITIAGGRFDAGALIPVGDLESAALRLASRQSRTSGDYTIVIVGEIHQSG